MRLPRVLKLIEETFEGFEAITLKHEVSEDKEYLSLRIEIPRFGAVLEVREFWKGGELKAYGYYVRLKGYEEWWDNRPHHREIPTFPHHRHVMGKVEPLFDHSLEAFLSKVKELMKS